MKKVLLTLNNNKISGIEMFAILLEKHIDKTKFACTFAIPMEGPICDYLNKNNVKYFIFDNGKSGKYTVNGFRNLFGNIQKNKYDIIHAQAGIAPCFIGRLLNTPLLIEHKHGLDFTPEQIEDMGLLKIQYEKLKKYLSDYTITGCKSDKNILINRFGFQKGKVRVLYNGIEDPDLKISNFKPDKKIIGTIGRLTYQKGQEYLIEAANIILKKGYDIEFHIYGEGEKRSEYEKLISDFGISKSVFLKGYTENVSEVIKTFTIFALPSRYEGIPYVLLNAMSLKVPLISTDVGGINEVIINNENGILIKKEDSVELAESIVSLLKNEKLINKLTENARKDFEKYYQISKTINKIELIYSENIN